tara:strand:+ start:310 stop:1173 length:864 start_codon:yes stop_codon:yes gene_type:complete
VREKNSNFQKDRFKKGYMDQLTVEKLINAGAHFGHPTHRWNPNYKNYISMKKNGVYIIDMEKTSQCINVASKELSRIVKNGGNVLFVGTKKQAKDAVQQAADRCGMYYIVERWLGGTLTNYGTIKKSIKRLLSLEKESSEIYSNLTKKETGMLERERIKLADLHRGIKDMKHLPAALFFIDGIHEKIAISEAKILGIPTFGIIDSNTDPRGVDFPIPANDDSMKTIKLIVDYFANVIITASGGEMQSEELINEKSAVENPEKDLDLKDETNEDIKTQEIESNKESIE